jgi:hypothetical protein
MIIQPYLNAKIEDGFVSLNTERGVMAFGSTDMEIDKNDEDSNEVFTLFTFAIIIIF